MLPQAASSRVQSYPAPAGLGHQRTIGPWCIQAASLEFCKLVDPGLIAAQVHRVEQIPPLATGALVEEARVVVPQRLGRVRNEFVGTPAHLRECGRLNEFRPGLRRNALAQPVCQAPHLALEVGLQIIVVEEHDVRTLSRLPESREMMDRRAQAGRRGGLDPRPEPFTLAPFLTLRRKRGRAGRLRSRCGRKLGEIVQTDCHVARSEECVRVHVLHVVTVRQRHVARVSAHTDVGHPLVERQSVQRRVGLDEPAVLLSVQIAHDIGQGPGEHVEPGRDKIQRGGECPLSENQQRADHLQPGDPAFDRRAEDDVAVAESKPVPPRAIRDHGPIPRERSSHWSILATGHSPRTSQFLIFAPKGLVTNLAGFRADRCRMTNIACADQDRGPAVDISFVTPLSKCYLFRALGDAPVSADVANDGFVFRSHLSPAWPVARAGQSA